MRYGFLAAIAGAMLVGLPAAATAAPYIIATNVAAKCTIVDGTATTVTVTLNDTTSQFYGSMLVFRFTPVPGNTGIAQNIPKPAGSGNPVNLAVSPGVYTLQITAGTSTSVNYNVTVPAFVVRTIGSHKMCINREVEERRRINGALVK